MSRFVPRHISQEQAAQGYNNEGRGLFLGCIADVAQHEVTCAYRKNPTRTKVPGESNSYTGETCNCWIGLWQEKTPAVRVAKPRRAKAKSPRGEDSTMAMNRSAFGKQVKPANLTAKPMRAVRPGMKRLAKAKTPTKVKRGFSK